MSNVHGSAAMEIERREVLEAFDKAMRTERPFSYLRLGDGEVNWMLWQMGHETPWATRYRYTGSPSRVDGAYSVTGLEPRYFDRLRRAYENCSWLDQYVVKEGVVERLAKLKLQRAPSRPGAPTYAAAKLFFDWATLHFGDYIRTRRCLFWGAESPLLRELHADPRYRRQAGDWWPSEAEPVFVDVRDGGRNYSENLELLFQDLRDAIRKHRPDTLFLSLATGAKILGYELSEEFGICAFDFGSIPRGLAYAATPGYHAHRSFHTPFFFKVDFETVMDATEKAYPELKPEDLLAKAHGQLAYELQRKEYGRSLPPEVCLGGELDLTQENLERFRHALAVYRQRYAGLRETNAATREQARRFDHWCGTNLPGWQRVLRRSWSAMRRRLSASLRRRSAS